MTEEEIFYIFNFYSGLLPEKEKILFSHSTTGIQDINIEAFNKRRDMYFKNTTFKNDPELVGFVSLDYNEFIAKFAEWLVKNRGEEVFINRCPKCNGLARTPHAKQCKHCFYSWH